MNANVAADAHALADAVLEAHVGAGRVHGLAQDMLVTYGDETYPISPTTADALALAGAMAAADAAMAALAAAEKAVREIAHRAEGRK